MALDENNHNRDYLYGRLLAVAEKIEQTALIEADELKGRRTTAERLMLQFVRRPTSTWFYITEALSPYLERLHRSPKEWVRGFVVNRTNEITKITNLFLDSDFLDDKKRLSGEFLLGYHAQKMSYWKATDSEEKPVEEKAE